MPDKVPDSAPSQRSESPDPWAVASDPAHVIFRKNTLILLGTKNQPFANESINFMDQLICKLGDKYGEMRTRELWKRDVLDDDPIDTLLFYNSAEHLTMWHLWNADWWCLFPRQMPSTPPFRGGDTRAISIPKPRGLPIDHTRSPLTDGPRRNRVRFVGPNLDKESSIYDSASDSSSDKHLITTESEGATLTDEPDHGLRTTAGPALDNTAAVKNTGNGNAFNQHWAMLAPRAPDNGGGGGMPLKALDHTSPHFVAGLIAREELQDPEIKRRLESVYPFAKPGDTKSIEFRKNLIVFAGTLVFFGYCIDRQTVY
ncbi:hypothetical protein GE09DRAFT_1263582 [Coniochaeta sp. 2T2.1]|nr:hypothetical protein GE09DRAFT_1263582 [Coniochaeta sp. 2T2.1]